LAVDGQGDAGRHLIGVGHAHDERAQAAHFLMQEPDGVEFFVVGAERVGADQFGKRGSLVGRSRAQRAHLMEHDGNSARSELPSPPPITCTASDASSAMDRNYSCPDEATMQAPPEGGAWQVDIGWLSLRAFLPPSGLVCPNERLQRASLRS